MRNRVTQEPGRSRCFHALGAVRGFGLSTPGPLSKRPEDGGSEHMGAGSKWYRQAKETKCGEKGQREVLVL
jgi:hypothetical protein